MSEVEAQLRRWAYAAGHIESEVEAAAGRVYARIRAEVEPRTAELEKDSARLAALEAAGVDNWEGYGHAMAILHGEED